MAHQLLDAREAAAILRMDTRTLIRWARLGQVPAHPLGEGRRKLWRFLEHELLEWVETRESVSRKVAAGTMTVAIGAHARRTA
jgi:predicted site-specific integrase-resolvase